MTRSELRMESPVGNILNMRGLAVNLLAAQEEERRRVARELHDELGQRLALLEIQIEQMERQVLDAAVISGLEDLRGHVSKIAEDVHRICYRLHPSILENLGLLAALETYCEEYTASAGIKTRWTSSANLDTCPRRSSRPEITAAS